MQLPAPARECTDAELQTVWDHYTRRQPQPLEPMRFEPRLYEEWQAAHAATDVGQDADPLQVARGVLGWPLLAGAALSVGLIALALVLL